MSSTAYRQTRRVALKPNNILLVIRSFVRCYRCRCRCFVNNTSSTFWRKEGIWWESRIYDLPNILLGSITIRPRNNSCCIRSNNTSQHQPYLNKILTLFFPCFVLVDIIIVVVVVDVKVVIGGCKGMENNERFQYLSLSSWTVELFGNKAIC